MRHQAEAHERQRRRDGDRASAGLADRSIVAPTSLMLLLQQRVGNVAIARLLNDVQRCGDHASPG